MKTRQLNDSEKAVVREHLKARMPLMAEMEYDTRFFDDKEARAEREDCAWVSAVLGLAAFGTAVAVIAGTLWATLKVVL